MFVGIDSYRQSLICQLVFGNLDLHLLTHILADQSPETVCHKDYWQIRLSAVSFMLLLRTRAAHDICLKSHVRKCNKEAFSMLSNCVLPCLSQYFHHVRIVTER